ncbi:hypothetical protein CVV72_10735 [Amycolatopsis sp. TNS106]|nr:hypothetical protein CVV72_10735 [Amycolatopsis sp. TNS106]
MTSRSVQVAHPSDPLNKLLARENAHHLEIHYDDDGSVDQVSVVDARWCELVTYESDELSPEERQQAESLFDPDGAVYPADDTCCRP